MEDVKIFVEKITALENQAYLTYLQLNALVKQLADKEAIDTAQLIKDMDELNKKLIDAVEEEANKEEIPVAEPVVENKDVEAAE